MIRKLIGLSLLVLISATFSSCITINDSATDHSGMMHNSTEFSSSEIMFAQMMIPHHEQAVLISGLAETRSTNQEVLELARKIKAEQIPEIEQMKSWLPAGYDPATASHGMDMSGMLDIGELAELENSSGTVFDGLFLEGMIAHHEGAIEMTAMLDNSSNEEAKILRSAIIESQSAEIEYMKELLKRVK